MAFLGPAASLRACPLRMPGGKKGSDQIIGGLARWWNEMVAFWYLYCLK